MATATTTAAQPPAQRFLVPKRESENVKRAQRILRREETALPDDLLKLVKSLKEEMKFSYARRVLGRARRHKDIGKHPERVKIFQESALCTYKDEDLPADERLDAAFRILGDVANFETTPAQDQETFGLLGGIHKRKWEIDNQRENLERSLYYYSRGYDIGPTTDQGYTGINAAFVLDRLASLEKREAERAGQTAPVAEERRQRACAIRQDIVNQVGKLVDDPDPQKNWVASKWWYYATLAEAHFGLGNYDEAVERINKGKVAAEKVYEWELETCARQLAALARIQLGEERDISEFEGTPAWKALEDAFGSSAVARTAFAGKIGLALSGGGFRASLYHLGVLARLAELDVLRRVDVLSCVSGGSIVGAYYYLKVRHWLQTHTDSQIKPEDYVAIIKEMIDEFVSGVKKNIRTRVALNPIKNFRMLWSEKYSRTARAAELYEKHLYQRVKDGHTNGVRWFNKLTTAPLIKNDKGELVPDTEFSPKYQNWRRNAKVPILVLNAATLNTGHTWQFTATWMGEAPGSIESDIDGNERLRRMYYGQAPKGYNEFRLGRAVGASAAVPAVFEPLTLDNLYPDRIVRLVDGGVTDNQGVASLLEQDCRVVLVSDASGQMESQPASSRSIFGTLLRTNNMFQARIRQAQYENLKGRRRSNLLRGFMFVHLKGGLEVDPKDWKDTNDPYDPADDVRATAQSNGTPYKPDPLTPYKIDKEIQQLLSALRTDLDSFSEAEAYALMTSAYRMTEYQFEKKKCVEGFVAPKQSESWKFLEIEPCMKGSGPGYDYLKRLLTAGASQAFRVWKIDPVLKVVKLVTAALVIIAAAVAIYSLWNSRLPEAISQPVVGFLNSLAIGVQGVTPQKVVSYIVYAIGTAVGLFLLMKLLAWAFGTFIAENTLRIVRFKDTARRIILVAILSTLGWLLAGIHLLIFDRRFLSLSSLDKVKAKNR